MDSGEIRLKSTALKKAKGQARPPVDVNPFQWNTTQAGPHIAYALPKILELLPAAPARIFDVGCGNGSMTARLSAAGYSVIGIDSSDGGITLAQQAHPHLEFRLCSAYSLPEIGERADAVVASEVIEHLMQPRVFLENLHSILKPGGTLVLTTPYHGYLKNLVLSLTNSWDRHFSVEWEGGHVKFFSEKSLSQMAQKAGFENITFHNAGRFPGLWKSMVLRATRNRK